MVEALPSNGKKVPVSEVLDDLERLGITVPEGRETSFLGAEKADLMARLVPLDKGHALDPLTGKTYLLGGAAFFNKDLWDPAITETIYEGPLVCPAESLLSSWFGGRTSKFDRAGFSDPEERKGMLEFLAETFEKIAKGEETIVIAAEENLREKGGKEGEELGQQIERLERAVAEYFKNNPNIPEERKEKIREGLKIFLGETKKPSKEELLSS